MRWFKNKTYSYYVSYSGTCRYGITFGTQTLVLRTKLNTMEAIKEIVQSIEAMPVAKEICLKNVILLNIVPLKDIVLNNQPETSILKEESHGVANQ